MSNQEDASTKTNSADTTSIHKHKWSYTPQRLWYCRGCPATAVMMRGDLGGEIMLDEETQSQVKAIT